MEDPNEWQYQNINKKNTTYKTCTKLKDNVIS